MWGLPGRHHLCFDLRGARTSHRAIGTPFWHGRGRGGDGEDPPALGDGVNGTHSIEWLGGMACGVPRGCVWARPSSRVQGQPGHVDGSAWWDACNRGSEGNEHESLSRQWGWGQWWGRGGRCWWWWWCRREAKYAGDVERWRQYVYARVRPHVPQDMHHAVEPTELPLPSLPRTVYTARGCSH